MKYYKSPRVVKIKVLNPNEEAPEAPWVEVNKDGTLKGNKEKTTKKEK